MRNIIINDILIPSLIKLYYIDIHNIQVGASERNICARLAHHMENIMREYDTIHHECIFRNYYADVEYNRMGNGDLKHYLGNNKIPIYMVSDLLIQSRGYERNLLAVEMKRKGNYRNNKNDRERLISVVSSQTNSTEVRCVHNTLVGAFIIYSPKEVKVELYEDVNGRGQKIDEFKFVYSIGGLHEDYNQAE